MDVVVTAAILTYSLLFGELFLCYPSGGVIERVCLGETCFAPTSQIAEVRPWTGPAPVVMVTRRFPDGTRDHLYAVPLGERES